MLFLVGSPKAEGHCKSYNPQHSPKRLLNPAEELLRRELQLLLPWAVNRIHCLNSRFRAREQLDAHHWLCGAIGAPLHREMRLGLL